MNNESAISQPSKPLPSSSKLTSSQHSLQSPQQTTPSTNVSASVIIRFATHPLPDLPLYLSRAQLGESAARHVKSIVRKTLPVELSRRRMKLIFAGRVVIDEEAVGSVIWRGAIMRGAVVGKDEGNEKGKGKLVEEDEMQEGTAQHVKTPAFLHCSIGFDELSSEELAAEKIMDAPSASVKTSSTESQKAAVQTTAQPSGFDRLLGPIAAGAGQDGFTAADVATLRSQFRSIVAARHTPDDMPSAEMLRELEERWLESESFVPSTGSQDGGPRPVTFPADEDTAAMYDALFGVVIGYFWPLGALIWGLREQGVWSRRRGFAVLAGVGINLGFGAVRVLS